MEPVYELIDSELRRRFPRGGGWAWLARQIDSDDQTVNNWKRRRVPPERYAAIAVALGWSPAVLSFLEPPPNRGVLEFVTQRNELAYAGRPRNAIRVPIVGTAKLGGDGFYHELEAPTGHGDGFVEHYSNDSNAYGLRVKGDSMHPTIKHGQIVVVEPNGELVPGENVLIALKDGRKMVKELVTGRSDSVTVVSVNGGERLTFQREDIECIHSVAAVISASKWRPE